MVKASIPSLMYAKFYFNMPQNCLHNCNNSHISLCQVN